MKDWKFCPRCGNAVDRLGAGTEMHIRCSRCSYVKYDNPLPTTIGLVCAGGKILLLRRSSPPGEGKWDTVGGFLSGGETAEECLVREAFEEVGCKVVNIRPLGTYASVYGETGLRTIGVAFICELEPGADIELSGENSEYGWFGPAELPDIALDDVRSAVRDWSRLAV